jgi:hypothetical protein
LRRRNLITFALFSAVYTIGKVLFILINYSIAYVGVVDALLPLSIMFGSPAMLGLSLGSIVANVYGGFEYFYTILFAGIILFSAYIGWKICTVDFHGSILVAIAIQSAIIGCSDVLFMSSSFPSVIEGSIIERVLGSVIAINLMGNILLVLAQKLNNS